MNDLRRDMQEGFKRHDRLIQEKYRLSREKDRQGYGEVDPQHIQDRLMQLGIDKDKARRFEYIDKEGLYGLKGKRYESDIIVSNSHVDILVKSRISEEDIVTFYEKVNSIKPVRG